jgi:Protein of unknown function (DUF3179)
LVWESSVDDKTLNFELAGINNQNFIMRDRQTGSWWQQVSGEAIQGSYKGKKLKDVFHDEITFGVWKSEHPNGRVLIPDEAIRSSNKYESANWESQVGKMPVRISTQFDDSFEPRTLIAGLKINNTAKAYPVSAIEKQSPILDVIDGKPIVILLAEDKKSIRAFERNVDGKELEFLRKPESNELIDAETGSVWDFSGKATSGELSGKQLKKIFVLKDYWFDWKVYNPKTLKYNLGIQ